MIDIAIGTITDLGNVIKVNARIIDVETVALISVASGSLTKNESVKTLLNRKIQNTQDTKPKENQVNIESHEDSDNLSFITTEGINLVFEKVLIAEE